MIQIQTAEKKGDAPPQASSVVRLPPDVCYGSANDLLKRLKEALVTVEHAHEDLAGVRAELERAVMTDFFQEASEIFDRLLARRWGIVDNTNVQHNEANDISMLIEMYRQRQLILRG
jgi:alpha-ketoglutarate-dependent taurine dioxygenase